MSQLENEVAIRNGEEANEVSEDMKTQMKDFFNIAKLLYL